MILLVLLALGLAAILLQMLVPPLPFLVPCNIHFVALVVIYGALKLRNPVVFLLTAFLGLALDLLSPQSLGIGLLSLSLLAAVVLLQAEATGIRHWSVQILIAISGTFFFVILEYLLYSLQLQRWYWPFTLWTKMVFDSIFSAVIALVLFPLADALLLRRDKGNSGRRYSL